MDKNVYKNREPPSEIGRVGFSDTMYISVLQLHAYLMVDGSNIKLLEM